MPTGTWENLTTADEFSIEENFVQIVKIAVLESSGVKTPKGALFNLS